MRGRLAAPARLAALALILGACAGERPADCIAATASADDVVLIDHGWHTDIGVPADALSGPAAVFRTLFPGARSFVFSFGKRTFLTAKADDWSEYVLGPVPGPSAILVTGLTVSPEAAFEPADTIVLPLPEGGAGRLSAFIWRELDKDTAGRPRLLDVGPYPGSVFYAATATYTLARTCNAWSAEALAVAGVPVSPAGVVFAHQVTDRAWQARRCPWDLPPGAGDRPRQWQGGGEPSEHTTVWPGGRTRTLG